MEPVTYLYELIERGIPRVTENQSCYLDTERRFPWFSRRFFGCALGTAYVGAGYSSSFRKVDIYRRLLMAIPHASERLQPLHEQVTLLFWVDLWHRAGMSRGWIVEQLKSVEPGLRQRYVEHLAKKFAATAEPLEIEAPEAELVGV